MFINDINEDKITTFKQIRRLNNAECDDIHQNCSIT
jgi:hypothetical protein